MNSKINNCRVCGLDQWEPPWGNNNSSPSYQICVCCGVQFGLEDETLEQIIEYRKNWLATGATWFNQQQKPDDWDLDEQLQGIPDKYE